MSQRSPVTVTIRLACTRSNNITSFSQIFATVMFTFTCFTTFKYCCIKSMSTKTKTVGPVEDELQISIIKI